MSMELMVKAMKIRVGNPLRKLVLIKLADNASDQGECWPIRGVLPETLRMLLQVTHGSAFCSQQASYVRVGVWLTVVKGIHADIFRAR